jgi:hypothetical protein
LRWLGGVLGFHPIARAVTVWQSALRNMTPEEKAREQIDAMPVASRWALHGKDAVNLAT